MHAALRRVHWQAMELGVMGAGAPDSNGCWDGVEFWVEAKQTETDAVGLEPQQVGWISRRMRAGGRVFVMTWQHHEGGPRKGEAVSRLILHEGWDAAQLKAEGLAAVPPVLVLEGRPEDWDWEQVLSVLVMWPMGRR